MASVTQIEWLKPNDELSCPCCGEVVRSESGKIVQSPCEHFVFYWDGTVDGLEEWSDSFDEVLAAGCESGNDGPLELGKLVGPGELLQVDYRDHACGPVERTDLFAFSHQVT